MPTLAAHESWAARVRTRAWPIAVTAVVVATGMAYSLWWPALVRHLHCWQYPGDIWGAYRSAHFIGWGALSSVYAAGTRLVTFPGILLLFTPVAMLTGHLGLTEGFPFYPPHPTAWLMLGPYEILIGCSVLFACDALAEHLGVSRGRRIVLCVAEGVALWPMLVLWGHPEDAVALALAIYALRMALAERWTGAGWLFGAAVATQPLVLLMAPVLLAMAGRSRAIALVVRSSLPAVVLLAAPVLAEFHSTVHALVNQPNFPRIDHATPWTAFAPRLGGSGKNVMVAAGPGRIVALVAAVGLGWWARRWRDRPELLVWAAAVTLALRCLTESVMVPYYLWPALALGLVLVVRRPTWLAATGLGTAIAVTVCGEDHLGMWLWWGLVNGGLVFVLAAAFPVRASRLPDEVPIPPTTTGPEPVHQELRDLVGSTQ